MIKKLQLIKYRNFKQRKFLFLPQTTVIVGPNAAGKTNILEALFLLATGKSFRARLEEEMINYQSDVARVLAVTDSVKLEVVLTRGSLGVWRKKVLLNGVGKRLIDFAGHLKVVLFGPWDLDLITSSPSLRRKFLDTVLSQVDREYRRASLSYEKGLRQRNRLLYRIREEGLSRTQLLFWDQLLIKNWNYLSQQREKFLDFANASGSLNEQKFQLEYDRSAISESRLEQYSEEEVAAATTLVGPHRDDFIIKIQKPKLQTRELATYGSRGEQRMGVLWLKLAEMGFIEDRTNDKPTLLLDDIFSELDHEHRKVVMETVKDQQTIITTADEHFIENIRAEIVKL